MKTDVILFRPRLDELNQSVVLIHGFSIGALTHKRYVEYRILLQNFIYDRNSTQYVSKNFKHG